MKLTFTLDQHDYLQHQLFAASTSKRIKNRRTRSWIIATAACFAAALSFYNANNLSMFYAALAFSIFTLLFFPLYLRQHYKDHYAKFIADAYKNRLGQSGTVNFLDTVIETKDPVGESKINLTHLDKIIETGDYFYVCLQSGETIVIPKAKVDDKPQVRQHLQQISQQFNIAYIEQLDWKWR